MGDRHFVLDTVLYVRMYRHEFNIKIGPGDEATCR